MNTFIGNRNIAILDYRGPHITELVGPYGGCIPTVLTCNIHPASIYYVVVLAGNAENVGLGRWAVVFLRRINWLRRVNNQSQAGS